MANEKLVMALRTIKGSADQKGRPAFLHFDNPKKENIKPDTININLNKVMQNMGGESFAYGTFKNAFDTDERVKEMVKDFSEKGITLKTKEDVEQGVQGGEKGGDKVAQMAKSATDVGDTL
jgi:hypothetical protein